MFRSPSTPTSPPVIDAEKNLSIGAIVVYLNQKLPNFPGYVANRVVKKNMAAEKKISRELCLFLNSIGSNQEDISLFHFYPEWDYDNSHRSSDLAVIDVKSYAASNGPAETFFVIEAKRLPTPGKTREREYVEGNLGGIQRYKKGHHGKDLSESAIVGYIQKNDPIYWLGQINGWIDDLINTNTNTNTNTDTDIDWETDDKLVFDLDITAGKKYRSNNTRIVNSKRDKIILHHYLLNLN